jgi:hypothetical protein
MRRDALIGVRCTEMQLPWGGDIHYVKKPKRPCKSGFGGNRKSACREVLWICPKRRFWPLNAKSLTSMNSSFSMAKTLAGHDLWPLGAGGVGRVPSGSRGLWLLSLIKSVRKSTWTQSGFWACYARNARAPWSSVTEIEQFGGLWSAHFLRGIHRPFSFTTGDIRKSYV